ncbi:hypothetical protein BDV32DRAFT_131338 [Aspergillus pseudonomiae]|nr:hypothetical protein BDV32DRAFT_131338 [Aspergillus pseudonomiae]
MPNHPSNVKRIPSSPLGLYVVLTCLLFLALSSVYDLGLLFLIEVPALAVESCSGEKIRRHWTYPQL